MSPFVFGFIRGITIPMYLLVGVLDGLAIAWRDYREDTAALRIIWRVGGET